MDFASIVSIVAPYAWMALGAALFLMSGVILGYRLYKRKGGKYAVSGIQFTALFLLMVWFVVFLGLTMLGRGANFQGRFNYRLFSGYISAWNNWSLSELQLIIFNMLMFMPLGFLLPLLGRPFRRPTRVLLISLLTTIGIEIVQLLTGKGIFELDDILHNMLGSMAGYLLMNAVLSSTVRRRLALRPVLAALAIPLVFTGLFSAAGIVYHLQEFGNLPIRPAVRQDTTRGEIRLEADLPATAAPAAIYHNGRIRNLEYAEKVLSLIKQQFELEQMGGRRIDGDNRVFQLKGPTGEQYTFTYGMSDATWRLLKNEYAEAEAKPTVLAEQRRKLEHWLGENRLLPTEAVFSVQNGNILRWDMKRPEDIHGSSSDFSGGVIMAEISEEDSIPLSLFYSMEDNSYVRHVSILPPKEAFEELKKGRFQTYNTLQENFDLTVKGYYLAYVYDTKGFYRPAYRFEGLLNGEEWVGFIPAM